MSIWTQIERLLLTLALILALGSPPVASAQSYVVKKSPSQFYSIGLGANIVIVPGIADPLLIEVRVVSLLETHPEFVSGKTVLELSAGCGLLSLVAAKFGARRVVAVDARPKALDCINRNAQELGLESQIETRLTPSQASADAYSAVKDGEKFDVVLLGASYQLDLTSEKPDTPLIHRVPDFSVIRDLAAHLKPGGRAILHYGDIFHHLLLVKYAESIGHSVRNHRPKTISKSELISIFNLYMARLLQSQNIISDNYWFTEADNLGSVSLKNGFSPFYPKRSKIRFQGVILVEGTIPDTP